MVYLISMIICCFFYAISKRSTIRLGKVKFKFNIAELLTVIIFTSLTAVRSYSVGTDTINYYYSAENTLYKYDSVFSIISSYYIEPGYGILEYFVMKIFGDVHYLFMIESIVLFIGLFGLLHYFDEKTPVAMSLFMFLTLYYNTSLNISRQFISIGIGLYAFKYLFEDNSIRYFLFCIMASMFHTTGLILFALYYLKRFFQDIYNEVDYYKKMLVMLFLVLSLIVILKPITNLLLNMGLLSLKYYNYIANTELHSSLIFNIASCTPMLLIIMLYHKKLINHDERNKVLIAFYLLGAAISILSSFYVVVGRLAFYLISVQIILYPQFLFSISKNKSQLFKLIIYLLFVVFLVFYWIYCIYYRNFGGTYPYESEILPLLNFNI